MGDWSILILSLKRLYPTKVSLAKLNNLLESNKITQSEFDFIVG